MLALVDSAVPTPRTTSAQVGTPAPALDEAAASAAVTVGADLLGVMMVVTDKGRKRTLAELHQLLARAGFYHTGAVKSPTFHTLVEAQQ